MDVDDYFFFLQHKLDSGHCYWKLWQSGMNLYMRDTLIFRISEVSITTNESPYRNAENRFKLKQDGIWCDAHLYKQRILEMHFPMLSIPLDDQPEKTVKANIRWTTKLLSLCVDHVDILLEDWYPTLGTRFMHTSEGNFLVNRIVPCLNCLQEIQSSLTVLELKDDEPSSLSDSSSDDTSDPKSIYKNVLFNGETLPKVNAVYSSSSPVFGIIFLFSDSKFKDQILLDHRGMHIGYI